jgi:type I restriction enzyme R subunit
MSNGEMIRRRNLPHWDVPTAAYFVTVCLEGSIPARGLLDLQSHRAELAQRSRPADQTPADWAIVQWKRAFARADRWLDRAETVRFLENDALAQVVVDALYFFAGKRYDLLGYVVMPNHLHWVFQPLEPWVNGLKPGKRQRTPRERIVHTIDRFTALRCNELLGRQADFWQREPYDHWVRGPDELERILVYIESGQGRLGPVATRMAAFVRPGTAPARLGVGTTVDPPAAGALRPGGTFSTCRGWRVESGPHPEAGDASARSKGHVGNVPPRPRGIHSYVRTPVFSSR